MCSKFGFIIQICCTFFISANAIKTRLTWVNGIGHNLDHMDDGKGSISDLFGGKPCEFCHNPTAMTSEDDYLGFGKDLTQAGTHKMGRITGEVNELVRHLRAAVKSVGEKGRVIHIAHSQGALITYLAAKQLTSEELSQIEVISFGGAAALTRADFPFNRVVNYYSVNDPILFLVPTATKALQSGIFITGSEPEFVFLTPRSGNPALDHSLLGPTYIEALKYEGRRFQVQYQNIVTRSLWPLTAKVTELAQAIAQFFLQYVVLPLLLLVEDIWAWSKAKLKRAMDIIMTRVISPLVLLLRLLVELMATTIRKWKGEEKYEIVKIEDA